MRMLIVYVFISALMFGCSSEKSEEATISASKLEALPDWDSLPSISKLEALPDWDSLPPIEEE